MTTTPWYNQRKHYRQLRDRLDEEGFVVVEAWHGRHLRMRVRRNGFEVTISCAGTPSRGPEQAVNVAMQQARRGTRVIEMA